MMMLRPEDLERSREQARKLIVSECPVIAVGMGTCGIGNGAEQVYAALRDALKGLQGVELVEGSLPERPGPGAVRLKRVGCFGFCAAEPLVTLGLPEKPLLLFSEVSSRQAASIARATVDPVALNRLARGAFAKIEEWDFLSTAPILFGRHWPQVPSWDETDFFAGQKKLVLRDAGLIDPENIDEYLAVGGYSALAKVLTSMNPQEVVAELSASNLRGRGGAGFPTGKKWELMRRREAPEKWVVCNADEGDPGAYMNRNEIESDPHMLVEGMAIGAYAMGAQAGFIYARAEYPLAVSRLRRAIEDARERGLLGKNILGSSFSFDLDLVEGAGAFVCGEETALIASAEGGAGRPRPRPPFPAQRGFRGVPTTINNVETWCNVPAILAKGADWFSSIGTERSAGTKVFSLVGKAKNTGLVELPLGTPLGSIVYSMGGGAGLRKRVRAVQTGGPSGGCIPADQFDVKVDYESLASLGAIMGSGGMVVMDSDNCMVDVARYFVAFTAAESCGKCAPCREGLAQMRRILDAVSRGEASEDDLSELERLALVVKDAALCGLGQTAANPVLTTLRYFREEYLAHIREKRCDAGVCEGLFTALCENSCPLHLNIPGYLQLLKEGRIEEAFELTLRGNPLPGTMGRICHFHCQMRCRRETLDEAVAQGEIHRYLADTMYKLGREKSVYAKLVAEKMKPSGKRVAIVGAGPAGIAAAFYLSRLGHEVLLYDEHERPGGILRYGIPAYRLPRSVLDKETALLKRLGVRFAGGTRVGRDLNVMALLKDCDAVLLAIGARADLRLPLPGDQLAIPGYEFLESFNEGRAKAPGRKIVVIGGGNVAIDAARTLVRAGSSVIIAYRRTRDDLPANPKEVEGAEAEGIPFRFLLQPEEILANQKGQVRAVRFMVMSRGPIDSSGRPRPVPSEERVEIECDGVITAVGERVDALPLGLEGLALDAKGSIRADRFSFATSIPKLFAVGDGVSGPSTAAQAMGQAKKAAFAIDRNLTGADRGFLLEGRFIYKMETVMEPQGGRQNRAPQLGPGERRNNFLEVELGYSGEQALAEAARCLRCDVRM